MMIKIDVAQRFSKAPFGRYPSDGDFCGENFRENILKEELQHDDSIEVDFSNVALGVGSSFLEEIFGGLVRQGYPATDLLDRIEVKDRLNIYDAQVKSFIIKAKSKLKIQ